MLLIIGKHTHNCLKTYVAIVEFEEQCYKEQKENPNQEKYIYWFHMGIPVKILFEELDLKKFTNKK
ncbi:MAG: hypothetical protein JSV23_03395 [Promethearchaeota archaeon]|nr:MAG: hypothetical protein JSV23_03395 [Candidatus Lokiarchaeota archaeon]